MSKNQSEECFRKHREKWEIESVVEGDGKELFSMRTLISLQILNL